MMTSALSDTPATAAKPAAAPTAPAATPTPAATLAASGILLRAFSSTASILDANPARILFCIGAGKFLICPSISSSANILRFEISPSKLGSIESSSTASARATISCSFNSSMPLASSANFCKVSAASSLSERWT